MVRAYVFRTTPRVRFSSERIQKILSHVSRKEKINKAEITFVFIGDRRMVALNSRFLHHHRTTDILTFPMGNDPLVAEVYINVQEARRQSKVHGVSLENELLRLVVHGVLHAFGYDDRTPKERKAMVTRQERYVEELSS